MPSITDHRYFAARAVQERAIADRAASAVAAAIHRRLAELYELRAAAARPALRLVAPGMPAEPATPMALRQHA